MVFSPGARLGPYEILAPLGAGGMGEVWRARDTRLGREVALKLLPDSFAKDAARLSRFEREAHLLAVLNHPNIGAIHGLEEAEGTPFLALELVEGEDLLAWLRRGPVPLDEALDIAAQIAEALEAAHAKGVVHRDLKPANVKVTPEGRVKVLDFGLAKALGGDGPTSASADDVSQSPTIARSGTLAGVILGTAAYMSPEQASGKAVDRRADIWSFGVVLFEMLTGEPLFTGETLSEILASVIKEEPDWRRLPADCPPAITRLLHRCLRKRPRERLQDIGDARVEIADVRAGVPEGPAGEGGPRRRSRVGGRERWAWAVALLFAALAGFLATRRLTPTAALLAPVRLTVETPEGVSLDTVDGFNLPQISPDGRSVVFASAVGGGQGPLWVHSLTSGEARPLAGTEGGGIPFWSPDSSAVAFFSADGLQRVNLAGGPVETICALHPRQTGGTWSDDGTILVAAGGLAGRIYAVRATGGEARPLTEHDTQRQEVGHFWPQFLPDGKHFLFDVTSRQPDESGVYVASLDAPNERKRILPLETHAVFAEPGHLLVAREGILFAEPFDVRRLEALGHPRAIARSVAAWRQRANWGWFSASRTGHLAYLSRGGGADNQLVWLDRSGGRLGTLGQPASYGQIALSPDGRQLAAEIADSKGQTDLWVLDVARGVASRVTADPAGEWDPVWSPEGRELIFVSDRNKVKQLFRKSLQGSESESLLRESPVDKYPESWSPDGKSLLYLSEDSRERARAVKSIWRMDLAGSADAQPLFQNGFDIDEPQISPDSRWLAYTSDDSGRWEVYIQPFNRPGQRVRVSTDGGGQPKWRRDGTELFYLGQDRRLTVVPVRSSPASIDVGLPVPLFEAGVFRADYDDYAPSADGQRFLVKVPLEKQTPRLHVVLNWSSLLSGESRAP